jgi:hypothetical protein
MRQTGRKFSTEYKQSVKQVFEKEGLEKAYDFVHKDHPKTTKRTIKSWVDKDFGDRVKNSRSKSYVKAKEVSPDKVAKWQHTSYTNDKEARKHDADRRKKRTEHSAKWAAKNRPRIRELDKKYWHEGDKKQKTYARIKKRKQEDLEFRIRENVRSRYNNLIKKAFGGTFPEDKNKSVTEIFGCPMSELCDRLRALYKPGMTDENYGSEWHIDHIKPCCLFDQTIAEERKECWHYSNLQPLWAAENLAKGSKYEDPKE